MMSANSKSNSSSNSEIVEILNDAVKLIDMISTSATENTGIYICIYKYIYIHINMFIFTQMYINIRTSCYTLCVYMYICVCIYIKTCMNANLCAAYVHIYIYKSDLIKYALIIYICTLIQMFLFLCVYICRWCRKKRK